MTQATLFKKQVRTQAKPFLKWAGGKSQLIRQIESHFSEEILNTKKIKKYFEPFIGGGALLIYLLQNYSIDEVYISDINLDLINAYKVIRDNPEELIIHLREYQNLYNDTPEENRQKLFLEMREIFNLSCEYPLGDALKTPTLLGWEATIIKTAQLIFLNKTCFNGLYRLNSKGKFNVPFGKYINPKITDEENILSLSQLLKDVNITHSSYKECLSEIDSSSFVYLDPPYRPLNKTASFNNYTQFAFGDREQIELAEFCKIVYLQGGKFLLSNSCPDDDFFQDLYSGFEINKIKATRSINSNGNLRGKIDELLIRNYSL